MHYSGLKRLLLCKQPSQGCFCRVEARLRSVSQGLRIDLLKRLLGDLAGSLRELGFVTLEQAFLPLQLLQPVGLLSGLLFDGG